MMRYTYEYKRKCVELYREGKCNTQTSVYRKIGQTFYWWALVEQAIAQRIKKILAGMGVAASAETE